MKKITISTEFIKLQQFLKLANVVSQGSEAKFIIADGFVKVNGETVRQRGKKIRCGDVVEYRDMSFEVCSEQSKR